MDARYRGDGEKTFWRGKGPLQTDEYDKCMAERDLLLQQLGRARSCVTQAWLTLAKRRINAIQKQMRAVRRQATAVRRKELENALHVATEDNRRAEVQALCRLIAGTRVGVRKRKLGHLASLTPSAEELRISATSPAAAGGLSGEVIANFKEAAKEISDTYGGLRFPVCDAAQTQEAEEDLVRTARYMKQGAKRKATPPWSIPAEVFLMIVEPAYYSVRPLSSSGLGAPDVVAEAEAGKFNSARVRLRAVVSHSRAAAHVPHIANLSKGFLLDKANGKEGLLGQRIVHLYCPWWRNYFGAALKAEQRKTPFSWPPWCHAYLAGRRREGAMITQRCLSWTLASLKLSCVNDLRDMTNAFACTAADARLCALSAMVGDDYFADIFSRGA